jgi:phosphotransferase system enzyme I (PtsP)
MAELRVVAQSNEVSPLQLLREIRDVMTSADKVQTKLDRLVHLMSNRLSADVCSIYIMRAGQVLELYASAGLRAEAIHQTRLAIGEGLVGEIASDATPLNLADAQSHPKFAYRPETGEEIYQSFVGVPIMSHHQVLGVLVVQGKTSRVYSELQMEVLQTVAMVLAELAVSQQLVDRMALARERVTAGESQACSGQKLSPGLAKAPAVLHRPAIEIQKLVADDVVLEEKRLNEAVISLQKSIESLLDSPHVRENQTHADIMETYRMFTQDQGWLGSLVAAVHTGLTAEAAVKKVLEDLHVRLANARNPYVRQRIEDLEDISTRLLHHLCGVHYTSAQDALPEHFILVAKSLGPAELLEYPHTHIKGIVLEKGSAGSHITLIARMMDIPVVSGVDDVTDIIQSGDMVVVDGDNGEVYIRPSDDFRQEINEHIALRELKNLAYESTRGLPSVTIDGVHISLNLNVGLHLDARSIAAQDVDGIGLYRTELPYLAATSFPTVEAQKKIYGAVLEQAKDKRVIFRTFDIGGDKEVPYLHTEAEENPAMGWRATRIGLDQPMLLRYQLRALLESANGGELSVMFPMIASVSELDDAKGLLELELHHMRTEGGVLPSSIRVGVMLEIPSLLFDMPALLKRVDFISVGSNDLLQFFFAADRSNDRVVSRYDVLSASVLRMMRFIFTSCEQAGVDVGFCGNMVTRPLEAMALMACGLRSLSVPPAAVGAIKQMVRSLNLADATAYMQMILEWDETSLRQHLQSYAKDHKVYLV